MMSAEYISPVSLLSTYDQLTDSQLLLRFVYCIIAIILLSSRGVTGHALNLPPASCQSASQNRHLAMLRLSSYSQ